MDFSNLGVTCWSGSLDAYWSGFQEGMGNVLIAQYTWGHDLEIEIVEI